MKQTIYVLVNEESGKPIEVYKTRSKAHKGLEEHKNNEVIYTIKDVTIMLQ